MAVTPFQGTDTFNMAAFNGKINEAANTYVAQTGGGMTGPLDMGGNKITSLATPTNDGDAVNKGYVDGGGFLKFVVGTYTGTGDSSNLTLQYETKPQVILISCDDSNDINTGMGIFIGGCNYGTAGGTDSGNEVFKQIQCTWNDNNVVMKRPTNILNYENKLYNYIMLY